MPFAFNQNPLTVLPSITVDSSQLSGDDIVISVRNNEVFVSQATPLHIKESKKFDDHASLLQLGKHNTQTIYIHNNNNTAQTGDDEHWWGLRRIAAELPSDLASIAAQACAVNYWHQNHSFCSKCGRATHLGREHSRVCIASTCNNIAYPRIDPAIIVSVVNEDDEILLSHEAKWKDGMYSVLAGFLNHGESLEQCVAREVKEETSVRVDTIRYLRSQSWPFPGSIMIGFYATAKNQPIVLADDELEDAFWISRQTLRKKLKDQEMSISSKDSISRYLIDRWLDSEVP